MKNVLLFPFKILVYIPIYIYKYCISPLLPHVCRYYPSCSNYFIQAVKEYGPFKGSSLGIKRLLRCTPKSKRTGFDPVPINLKGGNKWIF